MVRFGCSWPVFANVVSIMLLSVVMTLTGGWTEAVAQSSLCSNPAAFCGKQLEPQCLSRVGAGAIAADAPAACDDQFNTYRECLALIAGQCGDASKKREQTETKAIQPKAGAADGATMTAVWSEIKDSGSASALESFAETYAGTPLAALAKTRAAAIRAGGAAASNAPQEPLASTLIPPEQLFGGGASLEESGFEGSASSQTSDFAFSGPTPTTADAAQAEIQRLMEVFGACTQQSGDPTSTAYVQRTFWNDVNDPLRQAKLSDPRPVDDAVIRHLSLAGIGDEACAASMIERISAFSPEALYVIAELLVQVDAIHLNTVSYRPTIGAVNNQYEQAVVGFAQNLLGAMTITSMRYNMGLQAPPDTRAQVMDALQRWTHMRRNLRSAFPKNINAPTPPLVECGWAGVSVDCALTQ